MFASLRRALRENRSIPWTLWFYLTYYPLNAVAFAGLWLAVRAPDASAAIAFKSLGIRRTNKAKPVRDYRVSAWRKHA